MLYRIYKLKNSVDDQIYVGCTSKSLAERWAFHKLDAIRYPGYKLYRHVNSLGADKFKMVLLETVVCLNLITAREIEQHHMDVLGATLNTRKAYTGMSRKSYVRNYQLEHPEQRKESVRKYDRTHRKQRRDAARRRRLTSKYKERAVCECGKEVYRVNLRIHRRSARHCRLAHRPKSLPMVETTELTAATGKAMGAPMPVAARPVAIDPTPAATSLTLTAPP